MYLIDIIGKISTNFADLRWISAFRFYGSALMDGVDWGNIAILLVVSVALLLAAIALFERRDIYT
jgi:ABC-2 type transport system permease protein